MDLSVWPVGATCGEGFGAKEVDVDEGVVHAGWMCSWRIETEPWWQR